MLVQIKGGCGCNHFIFEGPSNAGKRSMIRAMLREVFGADRVQVTEEVKEFNIKVRSVFTIIYQQLRLKRIERVQLVYQYINNYCLFEYLSSSDM